MREVIKNMKIRFKILIIVAISAVSLVALGFISMAYMNSINQGSTDISKSWMPSVIIAEELNTLTSDYRIQEYKHILSTDSNVMASVETKMDEIRKSIEQNFADYVPLISDNTDKALMEDAKKQWDEYLNLSSQMLTYSRENQTQQANEVLQGESSILFDDTSTIFLELVEFNKSGCDDASLAGDKLYTSAVSITLASIVVIIVLVILLSTIVSNTIIKPVKEIDEVAKLIADEKLDTVITYQSKDELGSLAGNFNLTVSRLKTYVNYINEISKVLGIVANGNLNFELQYEYTGEFAKVKEGLINISDALNNTLTNINNSSDLVANSSGQMAEMAQALAEGATEQAGTVEELVATVQDVSSKIRKNADDATDANKLVEKARNDIEYSNDQMKEMIIAISEINEKSKQIVNIVGSIEDIASQTNLLALNAAIEAARAGEAGKGFAVVAEQVKVLAAQSAEAAKNTVELINGSIKAVDNGTNIANSTAESLLSVVDAVEEAAGTMTDIAEGSMDQAKYMEEVENAIGNIANVIQSNSATAEESSATSEELSGQAQILKDQVSRFVLKV